MSDLISRTELLNALNNKNIQITFDLPIEEILGEDVDLDDFSMLVQDAIQVYKKMVIDTIKNQPTAYDIDKVVEKLNCDRCESCSLLEVCAGSKCCTGCHKKIIEIVKQGGVSDDVCEWKIDGVYLRSPHNQPFVTCIADDEDYRYNYCPVCGNKIKAVE